MSEPRSVRIRVDGTPRTVAEGTTVAAALLQLSGDGIAPSRVSVRLGEPRAPLCGMGTCFECRVRIDGARVRVRSCLVAVRDGMEVSSRD